MIEGLPAEAATWRQDRPGWTQSDELAAGHIELLDIWGRLLALALLNPKKFPRQLHKPLRIQHPDRPGSTPPPQARLITTDPREISAFFTDRFKK